jgi:hypothetical protein
MSAFYIRDSRIANEKAPLPASYYKNRDRFTPKLKLKADDGLNGKIWNE